MEPKPYQTENIKVPRFEEEAGFYTTKERSVMMSKIRAKNTKPETTFRKALYATGIRFRIHPKGIPGKPDVAIKKYRLAVFVDGEFWHARNWEDKKDKIKTNRDFWIPKLERNIQRDEQVNQQLTTLGYTIFRFWESDVKKDLAVCVGKVVYYVNKYKEKS